MVLVGDKCQQQPYQTIDGRTTSTTSIINDHTFSSSNDRHPYPVPAVLCHRPRVRKTSRFYTHLTSQSATGRRDAKRHSPVPWRTTLQWRHLGGVSAAQRLHKWPSWPSLGRLCSESTTSSFAIYSRDRPLVTSLVLPSPTWTPSFLTNK